MSKYLDAPGYLERAYQTAHAFFVYPYEIYPEYYETYKWGLYNELVVLKLADALDREGFPDRAAWLRSEWEKKVKYFVYDDQYPFRSEYAFDRTAFESTYALAKYGATHDMKPDTNLWHDFKADKWLFASGGEARGFARLHGPPACRRPLRARLAGDELLPARRGRRVELHGGDGRLGRAGLRRQFRRRSPTTGWGWVTRRISVRGAW